MSFLFTLTNFGQRKYNAIKNSIFETEYNIEKSDLKEVINSLEPTIGIKTSKANEKSIPLGASKIGGIPDLPKHFNWPTYKNEPLSFCAQYNLSELNRFDLKNKLPKKGIIYIFIYLDPDWPRFLNKPDSFKVIYIENVSQVERTKFPVNYFTPSVFITAKIDYFQYFTLPDDTNFKIKKYQKKYKDFHLFYEDAYKFIDDICNQETDNFHQILGEDRSVQNSVVSDFAIKQLNIKTLEDYKSKETEIEIIKKNYEILLQLDCNDSNSNLSKFGGNSVIYFGIEPNNLKTKNFDGIIMAFQGT
ncbi:uncharacterized protein YwqG [Jejuia pallidilutea]|uniref:Uncharacterized protein YwqG n=1 Tax=Jejuia pallidilutea TaxID=504487 RepID=A0A362X6T4_9FLAO|nr:YwqG family protein [Jejuia pallidilutea]PQV46616.1 uncharacterized protein YwqG [Jejuia pallidilutea]